VTVGGYGWGPGLGLKQKGVRVTVGSYGSRLRLGLGLKQKGVGVTVGGYGWGLEVGG
jgi:hypothetical protein